MPTSIEVTVVHKGGRGADWLAVLGWGLAAVAFAALYLTSGYTGWATGFTLWSLLAVGLLVLTNRLLRGSGRAPIGLTRLQRLVWTTIVVVALASSVWATTAAASPTWDSRVAQWSFLVFVWALLLAELAVVGCVTYFACKALLSESAAPAT